MVIILNKPSLLTISNAFVIQKKYIMSYVALCIFPAADVLKKIMSTVDLTERNPHSDSEYTRCANCYSRTSITHVKILPTMLKRKHASVAVVVS